MNLLKTSKQLYMYVKKLKELIFKELKKGMMMVLHLILNITKDAEVTKKNKWTNEKSGVGKVY